MKKIFLFSSVLFLLCIAYTNCTQEPCMGCGVQMPDVLRFAITGDAIFANQYDAQRSISLAVQENNKSAVTIPLTVEKIALKSQKDSVYSFNVVNTYSMQDSKMPLQVAYLLAYKGKNIGTLSVRYAANRKNIEKAYFNNKELPTLEQCWFLLNLTNKDLE